MTTQPIVLALLVTCILVEDVHGQSYPVNLRLGVHTAGTDRNLSLGDDVTSGLNASIKGVEASIAPREGGIGIGGRILAGTYGDESFNLEEGKVFLGANSLRVEGAYGQRSMFGSDSTFLFTRVGGRITVPIGGIGVSLMLSGSKYLRGDFSKKTTDVQQPDGWEGETGIYYTTPRIPVYVQLGYRTDYFKVGLRKEHMSGVVFGIGLWLGGR